MQYSIGHVGDLEDHWSVGVRGNWRLTFTFEGEDAGIDSFLTGYSEVIAHSKLRGALIYAGSD